MEFPIGKKLFHLVVNPGTWPGARPWTWNWYKLQETSMEHDIPFGNSNRENGTTFFDFPLFLGIFQWDEPTKRVPFTAEPEIPEILTKWKAPDVTFVKPLHCLVHLPLVLPQIPASGVQYRPRPSGT